MSERCAVAYRRVSGLVTALDPAGDAAPVPATPKWTVHDLLAHLVGVARDAADGRLDGVATEAWTDARTSDAVAVAFDWLCDGRAWAGAPVLRFVTEVGERTAGSGAPVATVAASRFEVLRESTGRRTRDEIEAYAGTGPREAALLLAAPFFSVRATSLDEQRDATAAGTDAGPVSGTD
jgi:hypothetical protein